MLRHVIADLKSSKFIRNILILSSGTVLGQAVTMSALPILTRLYSPEEFGILGVYMSLLMVLSVAACLRFDLAIPLATSSFSALNLLMLSAAAATCFSVLLAGALFSHPEFVVDLLRQPKLEKFLWMIPAGVWFSSLYSAGQFWAVRKKNFSAVARTQFTRAVGTSGIQFSFGILNAGLFGLLLGYMLYGGIGIIGLMSGSLRGNVRRLKAITIASMGRTFLKFKQFPLYSVPESFLNTAAVNLPTVIIAAIVSPREAGYLVVAQRIIAIPVGLLGSSLSRVYMSESGLKQQKHVLFVFTRSVILSLGKIAFLAFLPIAIASPYLFPLIFGADWHRAGLMVVWLTPAMMLQLMVSPIATILHSTNNNKKAFYLQLGGFFLTIGAILVASKIIPTRIFEAFAVGLGLYYLAYLTVICFVLNDVRHAEQRAISKNAAKK